MKANYQDVWRLSKMINRDRQTSRRLNALQGMTPQILQEVFLPVARDLVEQGKVRLQESDDAFLDYDSLVLRSASGHPEMDRAVKQFCEEAYEHLGVSGQDEVEAAPARLGAFANATQALAFDIAPELAGQMGTTVTRAVHERGPLGPLAVAVGIDPTPFLEHCDAGDVPHELKNEIFRMNPPSDAGFVEPQAPSGFDAASAPLDDVRAAIDNDALDRLGRGPAGPYDALTNDDLQSLINRRD